MKEIGNIGGAKTLNKFVELGIPVYLPFGDNEKSDFTRKKKMEKKLKNLTVKKRLIFLLVIILKEINYFSFH